MFNLTINFSYVEYHQRKKTKTKPPKTDFFQTATLPIHNSNLTKLEASVVRTTTLITGLRVSLVGAMLYKYISILDGIFVNTPSVTHLHHHSFSFVHVHVLSSHSPSFM